MDNINELLYIESVWEWKRDPELNKYKNDLNEEIYRNLLLFNFLEFDITRYESLGKTAIEAILFEFITDDPNYILERRTIEEIVGRIPIPPRVYDNK